jgi:hypothetical protein
VHRALVFTLALDPSPELANPFVTIALATGVGEARNALIARASLCFVAIGDRCGTVWEVAPGLQFGTRVIVLEGAARVEGVRSVATADGSSMSMWPFADSVGGFATAIAGASFTVTGSSATLDRISAYSPARYL